ncbi:four helix bundle protein [bacterium]
MWSNPCGFKSHSQQKELQSIKITLKECKETTYWLDLIKEKNINFNTQINVLIKESRELRNIFSAIIKKHNELIVICELKFFCNPGSTSTCGQLRTSL